jgi:hypothetical protein
MFLTYTMQRNERLGGGTVEDDSSSDDKMNKEE